MPTCSSCGRNSPAEFAFCPACGAALAPAPAPREVRKTVTILFCDIVGSTALGEALDPESMRKVMDRYFVAMREAVERHGGTVEKFIGDAVMAVFGIPTSHEDDALRGARAAAEMRQALGPLNEELERDLGVTVLNRIGLSTGEVVAVESSTGDRIVTGDPVNTAARLEQAAGPKGILMAEPTYRLVRDAVEAEGTAPIEAKGKSAPLVAWRLIAVADAARRTTRDTPMVGRTAELRLLTDALERARRERACIILTLLGAAGVGKSRLMEEFLRTEARGATVLRGRCLPYGDGITFWPLIEMLTAAAGLSRLEGPDLTRRKLLALLGDVPQGAVIANRLGQLLGIAGAEAVPEETFWAVRKLFEALARVKPLVVDLDDLQWAEPTLFDLVGHVADLSRDAPILLVCSARPELLEERPNWAGGKLNATSFLLEPLDGDEVAEVIGNLLEGYELPAPALERIQAAADGNPLFIEQTVAMLIEEGRLERSDDGWSLHGDLDSLAVPPTIQALLAARLDRLAPEERTVLERAAVQGKVFHRGAVLALCEDPLRASADRHLGALLRRDLIRPETPTFPGEEAFRFRHLLIRDAAYARLPKAMRADLHERLAEWLEGAAGDRTELDELIAYHLERAFALLSDLGPLDAHARASGERAASLLIDAGDRAGDRGDLAAAATLWGRAVRLLPEADPRTSVTASAAARAMERSGVPNLGEQLLQHALAEAKAAGSPEAVAALEVWLECISCWIDPGHHSSRQLVELHGVAERVISSPEHGRLLAWTRLAGAIGYLWLGRMGESVELCERILADPVASRDRFLEREVLDLASTAQWSGATPVGEALRSAERDPERAPYREGVASILLALHGELGAAREAYRHVQELAEELGLSMMFVMFCVGYVELLGDRPDLAERALREAYELAFREGASGFADTVVGHLARAMHESGRGRDALPLLAQHADTPQEDYGGIGIQRAAHAMILADLGDVDEAERLAREGVEAVASTDDLIDHGETLLALAHALRIAGREEEATDAAREALDRFERKGDVPDTRRAQRFLAAK